MTELHELKNESEVQLRERLIPFWTRLHDDKNGGFYGLVTDDLKVHEDGEKGCILNSRILWFYSSSYLRLHDIKILDEARHAYSFLKKAFLDSELGGVFWSVSSDGRPLDDSKHCYCQAFAIYALAAYARAEGTSEAAGEAVGIARELFDLIESKMRDDDGYLEAFNRDFSPASNEKLSENGVEAARTMNTLLHVMEAYTELYIADGGADIKERLFEILDIFLDKVYIRERSRLGVFFDADYNSLIDLYSYGHDIEAAWLIDRALDAVRDYPREALARKMTKSLTVSVYEHAFRQAGDMASLPAECENGVDKETRVWWVQAEAVNGFLNGAIAAEADGDSERASRYRDAVNKVWAFIKSYVIDARDGGEWFSEVSENGEPDHSLPVVDPWKCPYHNGRMFMEIMDRVG